jgi:uncharacterized protein YdhG (YjbR/CyaY superfamily)
MKSSNNIDQYIAGFPESTQAILTRLRLAIKKSAPDAAEAIKYGIPTFTLRGNLVHFAAYKNHIGFYPTPSVIINFSSELTGYITSKGAIQFPIGKPIPLSLISKMVKFRLQQQLNKPPKKIAH